LDVASYLRGQSAVLPAHAAGGVGEAPDADGEADHRATDDGAGGLRVLGCHGD
jgi:hypothetical protein